MRSNAAALAAALLVFAPSPGSSSSKDDRLPLKTVAEVPLTGGSSRFDYESLDPKAHRLFIAHLGASAVIVVDTMTNRVLKTIPNISSVHGVLAVPSLGRVYATATGTNEVVAIDERSLQVVARIPGGIYPDGLAFVPKRNKLYVSDERGGTVTVIDTATSKYITAIALGGDVGNTQYDPRSDRVYSNVQTRGELIGIDPSTDAVVARYPITGCESNHGLLIDEHNRFAYVACEDNATLAVFDLRRHAQKQTFPTGSDPDVLAYDSTRSLLYVACESGTLSLFTTEKGAVRELAEGFVAPGAHVVAVDERTHRTYFPLLNPGGKPALRVMAPL